MITLKNSDIKTISLSQYKSGFIAGLITGSIIFILIAGVILPLII